MRVAVIGANGQSGADICNELERSGRTVLPLTHEQVELTDSVSVSSALSDRRPDVVVNAAAMHHVDRCEESPEEAFAVNAIGSRNLACWSRDANIPLLHISTDYVFDGEKRSPYEEGDLPQPLNVYGNSKLAGELFVRSIAEKSFVLRTSGLYGKEICRQKGPNFVDTMLRLARERGRLRVVDSEVLTPTSTRELARQINRLIDTDAWGLYHATAAGACSWYVFTREILELAGCDAKLEIAAPDEFPAKVPRPSYSVLQNRALADAGLDIFRPWQDGLREYLSQD